MAEAMTHMQLRPVREAPPGMLVQAILIDGRPTRLVDEDDDAAIKLNFTGPDRQTVIVVWTASGRKALAFK